MKSLRQVLTSLTLDLAIPYSRKLLDSSVQKLANLVRTLRKRVSSCVVMTDVHNVWSAEPQNMKPAREFVQYVRRRRLCLPRRWSILVSMRRQS